MANIARRESFLLAGKNESIGQPDYQRAKAKALCAGIQCHDWLLPKLLLARDGALKVCIIDQSRINPLKGQVMNAKPAGAIAAMTESLLELIVRFGHLIALESKAAGLSLAWMIGFVIIAAWLLMTGWITMLACLALILVQNGIVGWVGVLGLATLISFAGVAILFSVIVRRSRHPVFPGTRRQLVGLDDATEAVSEPSKTLGLAEQQVIEAQSALIGEYHLAQARLQHRVQSPVLLGSVFLCAIGVGYFTAKHDK